MIDGFLVFRCLFHRFQRNYNKYNSMNTQEKLHDFTGEGALLQVTEVVVILLMRKVTRKNKI
jgi:hypothetical protein